MSSNSSNNNNSLLMKNLEVEMANAQAQVLDLERQRIELQGSHSHLAERLQHKMEEINAQRKQDQVAKTALESHIRELQAQLQESARRLRQQIELNDQLQNEVAAAQLEKTNSEASLLALETEIASLKTDVATLQHDKLELELKYKHSENALMESRTMVTELTASFSQMEQDLDKGKAEMQKLLLVQSPSTNNENNTIDDAEKDELIHRLKEQVRFLEQQLSTAMRTPPPPSQQHQHHQHHHEPSSPSPVSSLQNQPKSIRATSSTYGWAGSPSASSPVFTGVNIPQDMSRVHQAVDALTRLCDSMIRIRTSSIASPQNTGNSIDNAAIGEEYVS